MYISTTSISRSFKSSQTEIPSPFNDDGLLLSLLLFLKPVILLLVCVNLTTLGTFHKWGHNTIWVLRLAHFPQHDVFKVQPCHNV